MTINTIDESQRKAARDRSIGCRIGFECWRSIRLVLGIR
jgi:hypothetical protein